MPKHIAVPAATAALSGLPAELRDRKQWLVWDAVGADKIPRGSTTNPATWHTFESASAAAPDAGGVGFVFTEDDPYVGVDLDDCVVAGELDPAARDVVELLHSYWELSPSGAGVHIIARGELPAGCAHKVSAPWGGKLEAYDRARFFTMTGQGQGEPEIQLRPTALQWVADRYLTREAAVGEPLERGDWDFTGSDAALLAELRLNDRFVALYEDRTLPGNGSELDWELVMRVAELTGDPDRIDRIWRDSALWREKSDTRDDYVSGTISKAIGQVAAARAPIDREFGRTAAELLASVPEDPDWLVPGIAARCWLVKFAGREKAGKGKLIATLLGCLERGEGTVFGEAADGAVTALIYTEEPEDSIREKVSDAGLRKAFVVFGHELSKLTWPEKVDALIGVATERGDAILFVDNISRAARVQDESGVELARAIELIGELGKKAGLSVWVDHHHRKAGGRLEDKSRGGTGTAGATDNNVEIELVGEWESRTRRISSRGRTSATIWTRTVALSDDGRSYGVAEDFGDAPAGREVQRSARLTVLSDLGDVGATIREFAEATDASIPAARYALEQLEKDGLARREGKMPVRFFAVAREDPAV